LGWECYQKHLGGDWMMAFRMGCYQKHLDALGKLKARAWISEQSPQQIQQSPLLHRGEAILIQRDGKLRRKVKNLYLTSKFTKFLKPAKLPGIWPVR